ALITFILLGVTVHGANGVVDTAATDTIRVQLLVWIFVMRVMMVITSAASYGIIAAAGRAMWATADKIHFETPLTALVWVTSIISMAVTFIVSWIIIPDLHGDTTLWWKLSL